VWGGLLALTGCGSHPTPAPPSPQPNDPCRVATESVGQLDTFRVALAEAVDLEHAPIPTNDSERLLFRQLYRNLVRVDCAGEVHPELAEAWKFDSGGRIWTFTLKDTTIASDGARLLAAHVLAAWRPRPTVLRDLGIDSVIATGPRTLAVAVREREVSQPRLFAEPELAIVSVATVSPGSNESFLERTASGLTVLDFVTVNGDPRDALDSGIDLLITRDIELAEYAARIRDLQTFPLPWSRTYALVEPEGSEALLTSLDSLRGPLARDAVKADARPAQPITCDRPVSQTTGGAVSQRIVYPAQDPVARGLAERIVALNGTKPELRAQGLDQASFTPALRSGTERGYIVPLARATDGSCPTEIAFPPGFSVQSLIETRARAIVRRGSPELTVDWDGTPRLR